MRNILLKISCLLSSALLAIQNVAADELSWESLEGTGLDSYSGTMPSVYSATPPPIGTSPVGDMILPILLCMSTFLIYMLLKNKTKVKNRKGL